MPRARFVVLKLKKTCIKRRYMFQICPFEVDFCDSLTETFCLPFHFHSGFSFRVFFPLFLLQFPPTLIPMRAKLF